MKIKDTYSGADWQTERPRLAQLLHTIDGMQGFVYGMEAGGTMVVGSHLQLNHDHDGLNEHEQLRVMSDLGQDALVEIDMLSADLAGEDVPPRLRWSVVEARQLMMCLRELAVEAREAMNFQNIKEIPTGVLLEFADSLRRIKLLLVGVDEGARGEIAA